MEWKTRPLETQDIYIHTWKSGSCTYTYMKKWKPHGHVWLFVIPWTVACPAPMSMEFSRQEHWIGLPFPSLGDLPNLGIEPGSPALQADSLPIEPLGKPSFHHIPMSSLKHLVYTLMFFFFFFFWTWCLCAMSFQSCLTLCKTMDHSPPGCSVHGMLQAGILEWLAMAGDLSIPGIEPLSLVSLALANEFFTTHATCLNLLQYCFCFMFQGFGGRHLGPYLPDQGSNLYSRHWKVKS